jgi:hypothetical protein
MIETFFPDTNDFKSHFERSSSSSESDDQEQEMVVVSSNMTVLFNGKLNKAYLFFFYK